MLFTGGGFEHRDAVDQVNGPKAGFLGLQARQSAAFAGGHSGTTGVVDQDGHVVARLSEDGGVSDDQGLPEVFGDLLAFFQGYAADPVGSRTEFVGDVVGQDGETPLRRATCSTRPERR